MDWMSFGAGIGATLLAEWIIFTILVAKKVKDRVKGMRNQNNDTK